MGQGTSRLNWECTCEDGKFNLTATYEEQKFKSTETSGKHCNLFHDLQFYLILQACYLSLLQNLCI